MKILDFNMAFDDRAVADRLAESIRQTDAALEVKVAEIAE